jgi:hypothetical protein
LGIGPKLRHDGTSTQPLACAINLTKEEKKEFCDFLCTFKVPSGYSSNIRKLVHVKEQKFLPMKAPDCDVMLTTMLPVAIRNILLEKYG